jgi:hypothetical protein
MNTQENQFSIKYIVLTVLSTAFLSINPACAASYVVNQTGGAITISSPDAGFSQPSPNSIYLPTSSTALTSFTFADGRGFKIKDSEAGAPYSQSVNSNIAGVPSSGGGINMIAGYGYLSNISIYDALNNSLLISGIYRTITGGSTWFNPALTFNYLNGVLTVTAVGSGSSPTDIQINSDGTFTFTGAQSSYLLGTYVLFSAGPSAEETQASLTNNASALQGVYSLQSVSMNNNLSNDCTLFDKHGLCASLSGTQTNIAGGAFEGTNGTLTVAYRVNNNLRVGAYLDQTLNVNETTGVHLNNGSPGFGGFGVWNEHVDGYGAQVRVAAGYDDKDMTVTRQVIESSEAGTGKTNLTSYGASIVASYAMWMPGDITFSPYAGIRHTKVKAGAYTEATTDVVTAPLTYSALSQNVTTALVGAKWTTRITDNAIAYASLGVEQDLKNNGGTYTATGVDGLTSIAFNPDISRTRCTASIGSYYNLGDRQRIGANLAWSEQAFTSIDATSLMVTYTAGF